MKGQKIGNFRWVICGLIFFATTVNYLDRQVISLLKSTLSESLHWDDGDYANVEISFKLFYAIGMLLAGRLIDKTGTKLGYSIATALWSIAAMAHGFVNSLLGFIVVRSGLGLTEAGNFPAAIKATAEWFPKKERSLATGIFNSGSNIGAIIAPLSVPFIAVSYGWQWAFITTGAVGFIWLYFWNKYYSKPESSKYITSDELNYILTDPSNDIETEEATEKARSLSWGALLKYKQTWAFAIGKFITDPVWWFYLFWLPDFLQSEYKLTITEMAVPVALVYTLSTIGSIAGGYLPLYFINKSWSGFKARKTAMLLFAMMVVPIVLVQWLGGIHMGLAILIIGLAAAAHQAWSANIFTTVSDMFPKQTTASVTGIGGMFGALGGILLSFLVQKNMFVYYRSINQIEKAYFIMFVICALSYLLSWVIMHLLVPKFEKIRLQ